jgi:hypothetical protein
VQELCPYLRAVGSVVGLINDHCKKILRC